MKINALYEQVTQRIISELERDVIPWRKPWQNTTASVGTLMPHNAITQRSYSGANVLLLWDEAERKGYSRAAWLTYNQAKEAGAHVRKGEKASPVIFVKRIHDEEEGKFIPMMRLYWVFNVAQIEGLPAQAEPVPVTPAEKDESLTRFIEATKIEIRHGGDVAAYSSTLDLIRMPPFAAFKTPAHYYATACHELVHATAHPTRLNRDLKNRFASKAYAAEELIAELGAAFLCASLGIEGDLRHAGYLSSWLELLHHDNRAIFSAASRASQAADWLKACSQPEELAEAA